MLRRTITGYTDVPAFIAAHVLDTSTVAVLVVAREGSVLARAVGPPSLERPPTWQRRSPT